MLRSIHVHDCFKGSAAATLATFSLSATITSTKKSLFFELLEIKPDVLVHIIPSYFPAFEQLLFKTQIKFPLLPQVFITYHEWENKHVKIKDLFIPDATVVLSLAELTATRFIYAIMDAQDATLPDKTN